MSKLAQSAHIYVLECVKARQSVFMSSKRVRVTRFGMPSALCAFATGVWLRSNAGMHNRTPGYAAGHRFAVRGSPVRRTTVPADIIFCFFVTSNTKYIWFCVIRSILTKNYSYRFVLCGAQTYLTGISDRSLKFCKSGWPLDS